MNGSAECPCRPWREARARKLNFPGDEWVGGYSCNISEWPLTRRLIKLKLLAQKHGRMSCIEYESRIHILTHSCINSCLFWGDSYIIPLNSDSFVILTGCPLACTLEIYLVHCTKSFVKLLYFARVSICFKNFARFQSPHPSQSSLYFIWIFESVSTVFSEWVDMLKNLQCPQ